MRGRGGRGSALQHGGAREGCGRTCLLVERVQESSLRAVRRERERERKARGSEPAGCLEARVSDERVLRARGRGVCATSLPPSVVLGDARLLARSRSALFTRSAEREIAVRTARRLAAARACSQLPAMAASPRRGSTELCRALTKLSESNSDEPPARATAEEARAKRMLLSLSLSPPGSEDDRNTLLRGCEAAKENEERQDAERRR